MKSTLVPGLKAELQHHVVTQELLSTVYPGGPPVFATPFMLGLMEHAAARAVHPHLDSGEASVGYGFNFHHLAPTPVGATVVATAEVTAVDKNMVTFAIEARDEVDLISRGTHVRAVIDMERFLKRVKRKSPG
ncbi:MAG TPA: thioesterase family protein [Pirellulales bacterium]|nr:thioesterase family protein [Pirellulales bacterium]